MTTSRSVAGTYTALVTQFLTKTLPLLSSWGPQGFQGMLLEIDTQEYVHFGTTSFEILLASPGNYGAEDQDRAHFWTSTQLPQL